MTEPSIPESNRESRAADHEAVLRELREKQQRALDALQKAQATGDPGIVYHSTHDVGLYEILKSGELWMSDYASLNDPSEIQYGISVGMTALRDEWNRLGNPPAATLFVQNFRSSQPGAICVFPGLRLVHECCKG